MKKFKRKLCNEELYKEVAEEFSLTSEMVRDIIVEGQSKFTTVIMKSGTFDSIRWPYLGVFKAKTKLIQVLNYSLGLNNSQRRQLKKNIKEKRVYNSVK